MRPFLFARINPRERGIIGKGHKGLRAKAFPESPLYLRSSVAFETIINNGLPELAAPDEAELKDWEEWLSTRPTIVADIARRFPPWRYYEMPKTKQIVVVESWFEDGTMRVTVVGDRTSIPAVVSFGVFGVPPGDLVACIPKIAR